MKLLTRTVRNYIIFSVLLAVTCIPLFYFSIQHLFVQELDEELMAHKNEFNELSKVLKTDADLKLFSLMNDEFSLKESAHPITADSIFTAVLFNEDENEDHPYRILQANVTIQGKPYILQIRESLVSTSDMILAIVFIQGILISVLLIGLTLINRKLSRTVWDPFYIILDKLKKYQIDKDSEIDLPRSTTAEFRDLSTAVAQLINKSREAFQSQKEFTENASHELQTPLAVIKGKMDLLMQTSLSEKQAELIHALQDATARMVRLNRNLLLLAQIENQQFPEQEKIDIGSVVEKLVNQFKEQLDQKHAEVKIERSGNFTINANHALIEVLLTNLLTNAIRYSSPASIIMISMKGSLLSISNAGEPLQTPEKIFDRFQRDGQSNVGSGIGLAIVKKICDNNGYVVSYEFINDRHVFSIDFNPVDLFRKDQN